jgi:hypothetical protein
MGRKKPVLTLGATAVVTGDFLFRDFLPRRIDQNSRPWSSHRAFSLPVGRSPRLAATTPNAARTLSNRIRTTRKFTQSSLVRNPTTVLNPHLPTPAIATKVWLGLARWDRRHRPRCCVGLSLVIFVCFLQPTGASARQRLIPNQTKFRSPTSVTSVCKNLCKNELSMPGFTIPEKSKKSRYICS